MISFKAVLGVLVSGQSPVGRGRLAYRDVLTACPETRTAETALHITLTALLFIFVFFTPAANANIVGQTLEGKPISHNTQQATLYIVWASWCSRCRAEMPELKALHQRYSPNVAFIGINVDTKADRGLKVQNAQELPYPSFTDPKLKIAGDFSVFGTPTLILTDARGKEVARAHGLSKSLKHHLKQYVNSSGSS